MGLLAAGAGAADGLQNYMLEQLKQRIEAETERHNQADESLQGRQIDETAATRNLTAQSQADLRAQQVSAAKRAEQEDADRKTQEDALLNDPNTPDVVKSFIKARRVTPKGENVPYELFTGGPKGAAGPVEDVSGLGLTRIQPDNTAVPLKGPDGKVMQRYHAPVAPSLAQSDAGFFLVPRTGPNAGQSSPVQAPGGAGQLPVKSPATILNRHDMAGKVASHFDDAEQEIADADSKGLLGPIAGRTMSDVLLNGFGTTGNPENDDLLSALQMDLKMLSTGVASIHGRGQGANAGIAKDLQGLLDQTKMEKAGLMGALRQMKKWTVGYATPSTPGAAAPAAGSTSDPLGLFTK